MHFFKRVIPPGYWNSKLIRNLGTLVSGTALSQIIMFFLTPILGRIFTPVEYGRLGIFLAVVSTMSTVAALRYDMAVMLPKQELRAKVLARLSFQIIVLVSGLTSLVCFLALPWVRALYQDSQLAWWLVASGLGVFLTASVTLLGYWFNRHLKYGPIARSKIVQSGGTAVAQLGLGLVRLNNLAGLALGFLIGNLLTFLTMLPRAKDLFSPLPASRPSRKELLQRYRKMPLVNAPNALLDSFRFNGISALIGTVALTTLGQYQMAVRLVQAPINLINAAVSQVFFQRLTEIPRGTLKPYIVRCLTILGAIQTIPFILVFFLSPSLFPWFLGEQWQLAGYYAQALIPWLYMSSMTSPISTLFVVVEKQQIVLIHSIFYTIVPIGVLIWAPGSFLTTLWIMSTGMGIMLAILVVLALRCAKSYDQAADLE